MTRKIIDLLGFHYENRFDVKGRLSFANLFPKPKKRCGIYLLNFSDDTYYIGQGIDTVRRFAQHRKNYDIIERLWFQPVPKKELNEVGKRLIEEAELHGLLLTNKTFVSNVIGETDLDLIISPEEQNQWLDNDVELSNDNYDLYGSVETKYKIKYQQNFEKLKQVPEYAQIKRILKLYIQKCLPAYKKTELSFWALSCLSSTNIGTYPRWFCMNVNAMEVFVIGYERKTNIPFTFFILSSLFYEKKDLINQFNAKYKTFGASLSDYRAAGSDQVRFEFTDLNELEDMLLNEPTIIASIKELNLRLMRKGGTIYSPYHCFDLVNDVLK